MSGWMGGYGRDGYLRAPLCGANKGPLGSAQMKIVYRVALH